MTSSTSIMQCVLVLALSTATINCGSQSGSGGEPGSLPESITLRADAIISAWSGWVERHAASQASIAVSYQGQPVAQKGIGRQPDTPAPIASLSKAITGICISKLVDNGQLSYEAPLRSVVPELAFDGTIANLLTHTSGLTTDITQNPSGYPGVDQEYLLWVSQQELNSAGTPAGSNYSYNNSNYAMLGAAIAQLTGKSYERACNELVLIPAGISNASLHTDWRIMSSWGGWKLSAVDHQRFISTYFNSDGVLNKAPLNLPNVSLGGGAHYGIGTLFRQGRNGGYNYWHSGTWHSDYNGVEHRFGAFTARWDNDWAISVTHNISTINGEIAELDSLLSSAAHQQ